MYLRRPEESKDDPCVDEVLGFSGLDRVMQEADYLLVCAALTPQTKHMVGKKQFAISRPGQVLINIGRGPLVCEPDLVEALATGLLRGAALDVFEQEPLPASSPLWDLPNVGFSSPLLLLISSQSLTSLAHCDNVGVDITSQRRYDSGLQTSEC
jgi:phosphoglycerate dehydrogenase-like enzyme